MKSLFKYSLDSHEQRLRRFKTNKINNLNIIIKHHVFFKYLIHIINFFC